MSIESLTQELNREKEEIKREAVEAEERYRELSKQLERIEDSIAVLEGKSPKKRSKKSSKKRSAPKKQAPRPDAETVADLAAEILHGEGTLPEAQLEARVSQLLEARAESTNGLRSILQKALSSDRFEITLSGWRLNEIKIENQHAVA